MQNLGIAGQAQPNASAYINPFANSAQPGPFNVKPPLLTELEFDLGVDDSFSDYADYTAQHRKRKE